MVSNDDLLNSGPNIELVNTPTTVSNNGTTGQTHTRSANVTLDGSVHLYLTNPTSQSGPYTIAADNRTQYMVFIADRLASNVTERAMGPGEWLLSGDEGWELPYTLKDKNDKLTLYIKQNGTLNPIPFVVSYSNLVKGRSFNMTESKSDFQTHPWTNSMVRYLNHSLKSYHLNDSTLFSSTTTLTAPLLYRGRTWSQFTGYTGSIPSGGSSIPIYYSNPNATWESCMTVSGIKSKDFGLGEDATGRCLNPNSFLYANSTLVLDNNKTPYFPMTLGKSVAIVLNQSHAYYLDEDTGKVYTLSVVRTNGNNVPARGPLVLLISAQGGGGSGAEGTGSDNVRPGAGGGGAGSLACILACPKEMDAMAFRIKLSSDTGAGGKGSNSNSYTSNANGKDGCSLTLMEVIGSINVNYLLEHPSESWDDIYWNTFATIGGGKGAKIGGTSGHIPGQGGTVQYDFGSGIGVYCVQTKNGSTGGTWGSTGGSVTASYALYNTDKEENQNINTKVYSSSATYNGGSAGKSGGLPLQGGGGGGATAFSKGGDGGTSPSYNGNVGGKGAGGGGGSFDLTGPTISKAGNGANGGVPYLVLLGQPRVV